VTRANQADGEAVDEEQCGEGVVGSSATHKAKVAQEAGDEQREPHGQADAAE